MSEIIEKKVRKVENSASFSIDFIVNDIQLLLNETIDYFISFNI